ncbi:hypothetical protein [Niallia sp. FSL W8-0635]|uniref:hypothetical protein n=1 Tax=Niallia sp. FSL W8-0635 TaxID=2975337 RepID=UPI002B03D703|nr:hypothetical protein [Yersinia enterocolitica]
MKLQGWDLSILAMINPVNHTKVMYGWPGFYCFIKGYFRKVGVIARSLNTLRFLGASTEPLRLFISAGSRTFSRSTGIQAAPFFKLIKFFYFDFRFKTTTLKNEVEWNEDT